MALLERLRFDPGRDRLWLTGDLVNRGPASLAVLREVKSLGRAVTVVLGNHDLHLLALAFAPRTVKRREPELEAVLEAPDAAELLDWLAARPLLHRDDALGWTLIHAGVPPQWTLDQAEACAREVEKALRKRCRGDARRHVRRRARSLVARARGRGPAALRRQLPHAPAVRRPQGTTPARVQGHGRGCAGREPALVPPPRARDTRRRARVRALVRARLSRGAGAARPRHGLRLGRCADRDPARPRSGTGAPALPAAAARAGD